MRRLLASALILCLGFAAQAQATCAYLPDTSLKIVGAQVFNTGIPFADPLIRSGFGFLWSNSLATKGLATSTMGSGYYYPGDRVQTPRFGGLNLSTLLTTHPEWVMREQDKSTPAYEFSDQQVPVDVTNSAVQAYIEGAIQIAWDPSAFNFVSFDNTNPDNNNGNPLHAWGVTNTGTKAGVYGGNKQSFVITVAAGSSNAVLGAGVTVPLNAQVIVPGGGGVTTLSGAHSAGAGHLLVNSADGFAKGDTVNVAGDVTNYTLTKEPHPDDTQAFIQLDISPNLVGNPTNATYVHDISATSPFVGYAGTQSGTTLPMLTAPGGVTAASAGLQATAVTGTSQTWTGPAAHPLTPYSDTTVNSVYHTDLAAVLAAFKTWFAANLAGAPCLAINLAVKTDNNAGAAMLSQNTDLSLIESSTVYQGTFPWADNFSAYLTFVSGLSNAVVLNDYIAGDFGPSLARKAVPQGWWSYTLARYLLLHNTRMYLARSFTSTNNLDMVGEGIGLAIPAADGAYSTDAGGCLLRTFGTSAWVALLNPSSTARCTYTLTGSYHEVGDNTGASGTITLYGNMARVLRNGTNSGLVIGR